MTPGCRLGNPRTEPLTRCCLKASAPQRLLFLCTLEKLDIAVVISLKELNLQTCYFLSKTQLLVLQVWFGFFFLKSNRSLLRANIKYYFLKAFSALLLRASLKQSVLV